MPTPDTECALLYTSGSTGRPKGCILSNHYFWLAGDWYRKLGGLCSFRDGEDRLITPLPLTHMNALAVSTIAMIMTGGCLIQLDRFHPSSFWQTVQGSGATLIHYLGVMPAILLQLAPSQNDRAHNLRFGFGAGVNPKHHAPFEARFGFPLIEAWSMTEVGGGAPIIAHHEPRHVGSSCIGKPGKDMEWQLRDDNGLPVTKGQPGELLVRRAGPNPRDGFFSGYFGNPQETEKVWEENWFHTGDLLREGPDGSLHFVDRKKSVIRRAGENISALEVEAVLSGLPGVKGVGVTAVPDDIRGDEVFAAIILEPGLVADLETAKNICQQAGESLSYFKVPGYVAFMDELPLTASQKLQRGEIKTLARQLVAAGKTHDLRSLKKKPGALT
jgi:acyl-coenzyme A synthetase/AMP-(fatty) acid ligase